MRKLMAGLMFLLLGAMAASAANLVSVSNGTGTVEYATITEALAACSGGETLTLLGDVTVAGDLLIDKPVEVDLAGYTLRNQTPKAQFIKPFPAADGLSFRNGTISSTDCCFAFLPGTYTVTVSNVVFEGVCVLYGVGGTLEYLEDCVAAEMGTCFISSWSAGGCTINVRGGVVAPKTGNVYDDSVTQNTKLNIFGGSFTINPAKWLVDGYEMKNIQHTVHGVTCRYRVDPVGQDQFSAEVVPTDGGEAVRYPGIVGALAACTNGCTLRLLRDCSMKSTFAVNAAFTLDLNDFTLESAGRAFNLGAGATDFRIVNGTCKSGDYGFMYADNANAFVTVSNCTVQADCVVFGTAGHATLIGDTLTLNYLTSAETRMEILCTNCHLFCSQRINDKSENTHASLRVQDLRSSHNMTPWLADGWSQIVDETTIDGISYRFRVLPTAEVGTLYAAKTISPDGTTTNQYATIAEAVASCPENGTVRLLQDCTVATYLKVPRNMTIDLNGLRLENQSGNFIQPAAGVTLTVKDGDLYGRTSLFDVNQSATVTVNATNCSIMGLCPVWGGGTLNTYSCWFRQLAQFKSVNGSATMNVYDGLVAKLNKWYDDGGNPANGTKVRVYSGRFVNNPLRESLRNYVLAPGSEVYYENYERHEDYYFHKVVDAATAATLTPEAAFEHVNYTNVTKAIENAAAEGIGGIVTLLRSYEQSFSTPSVKGAYGFDLGGHEIAVAADAFKANGGPFTLKNGTIRLMKSGISGIVLNAGTEMTGADGLMLAQGDMTWDSCGVFVPGNNARLVLDGATVSTARFVSWGGGTNTTIEVVGDGSNTCRQVEWPGTHPAANSRLVIRGGWWTANPTDWVTNNHVVLKQAAATPCAYRVMPWADICKKGWAFNPVDGVATVTGTCDAAPAAPITVTIPGEVPVSKTALVDLKGLTLASGALTIDSFVCDPAWPPTAKLTLTDGVLSVQNCLGTTVLIR